MLEQLEKRFLYSTTASATLSQKILTLYGVSTADDISVAAGRAEFTVHFDGKVKSYSNNAVKLIRVFGGDGDDSIIVSPNLAIRMSIEGGSGNDRIGGGALNDTIMGEGGNDTLVGNGGSDYLDGGAGDDLLEDRNTDAYNVLHGGSGTDKIGVAYYRDNFVSGGETLYDTFPGVDAGGNVPATVSTLHGVTTLVVHWAFGNHDVVDFNGPTALSNGMFEITTDVDDSQVSSDGQVFDHTYDITSSQIGSGILYTAVFNSKTIASVPIFLAS